MNVKEEPRDILLVQDTVSYNHTLFSLQCGFPLSFSVPLISVSLCGIVKALNVIRMLYRYCQEQSILFHIMPRILHLVYLNSLIMPLTVRIELRIEL